MALESPAFANQSSSYSAEQTRRAVLSWCARTSANTPGIITGGLLSASDCQISAPASGLSVNVSTGEAIVGGTEGGTQGGYGPVRISSTTNLTISTASPSLPRIDTISLTIADSGYTEPTGVSGNAAVALVTTGTPTSGANLTNLSGKAALPASSLLLGYCLVPAAASNIITADILNVATLVQPQFVTTQTYTPAWTASSVNPAVGNGTLVGRYQQNGKFVTVRVSLVLGTTSLQGSGGWSFSLPVQARNDSTFQALTGWCSPSSTIGVITGEITPGATTAALWNSEAAGNAVAPGQPGTFVAGNVIVMQGTYETV